MPKRKTKSATANGPAQTTTAAPALSTLEEIETMLAAVRVRLQEPDLTAAAHAKLSAEIRNYLKLKASIQRDEATSEDKVSHHPSWLKLRDEIVDVVASCKRCSAALSKKL